MKTVEEIAWILGGTFVFVVGVNALSGYELPYSIGLPAISIALILGAKATSVIYNGFVR